MYLKEEAALLFFDPDRHSGARDAKCAGEATQAAAFLICTKNLLTTSVWIGVGSWIFTALSSAAMAAIELFAHSGHDHCAPERHSGNESLERMIVTIEDSSF